MQRTFVFLFTVSIIALLGVGCSSVPLNQNFNTPATVNQQPVTNKPSASNSVACTLELKRCPDGSMVGRIPPNCDFAVCPPSSVNVPPPATNNTTPVSAKASVTISGFLFSPATITVKKGTTVTWINNDSVGHTVTADSGVGPASGLLNNGDSYNYTFDATGTYPYHCSVHPSMKGTVVVTE
jgi:plastocyanin